MVINKFKKVLILFIAAVILGSGFLGWFGVPNKIKAALPECTKEQNDRINVLLGKFADGTISVAEQTEYNNLIATCDSDAPTATPKPYEAPKNTNAALPACTKAQSDRIVVLLDKYAAGTITSAEQAEYNDLVKTCNPDIPTATSKPFEAPKGTHYAPGVLGNLDKDGKMPNGEYPSIENGGLVSDTPATTKSDPTCGVGFLESFTVKGAITKVLCTVLQGMGEAAGWLIEKIFGTVFDAYNATRRMSFNPISLFTINKANAALPACTKAQSDRIVVLLDKYAAGTITSAEQAEYNDLVKTCNPDIPTATSKPFTPPKGTHYAPGVLGNLDKDGKMPNGEYPSIENGGLVSDTPSGTPSPSASSGKNDINESSIKNALNDKSGWVVKSWKVILGLANVFVVIILLFLAIVNILHIQYDTYTIKKTLPTLIIGIILANFSIFITKMLVDASNVLTATFMQGDVSDAVTNLITAIIPPNDASAGSGQVGSFMQTPSLGALLLAILFAFFSLIAFAILGFLFYVRYIVILTLTVAAPLAFVFMAFPPVQGLFKQWWGWYAKFIFMKPVSIFFIWLATMVLANSSGNMITVWALATFLVITAIIMPFKLGGAIMSGWGAFGKWATGTNKGGYARKPVDEWWQRRKDQAGAMAKLRFPRLFAGAEADRIKNEAIKKSADSALKQVAWKKNDVVAWEGKAKDEETKLKDLVNKRTLALEEGKVDMNWWLRFRLVGVKNAGQMANDAFKNAANLELSTKNLEAHRKDATWGAIIDIGRDNATLSQQLETLKSEGIGLDTIEVDSEGNIKQTTLYKLDKNGEVIKDENGNPIKDVATYRDYLEGASFARMSGLAAKDPEIAQNYFNSAAEMEKKAAEFARTHATLDDKPVLYNAFMDKNRSGRIFSVSTGWILDEINTNTINENAETMPVRFKNGGYGWRNNRGTHQDLVHLAKGEYSKISPTAVAPAVAEYRTWLEFIGRKGGKDRGRFLSEFLENVDTGTIYGEENKGRLLRSILEKENSIRQGATDEFLAEAIVSAKRRGLDSFAGIDFNDIDFGRGTTQDVLDALKSREGFSSVDSIAAHPEIFRQLDLTPSGNTRAQRNMLDGVSDLLEESSNFCGSGNPVGYTVRTKDRNPNAWFDDFKPLEKKQDIATAQRRRAEKAQRAEQAAQQEQILTSNTPEQIIRQNGSAQRAVGNYDQASANLLSSENQLMGGIKINDSPIDAATFRQQIARAIEQSVANSFQELQRELQQQFSGLTINIPEVDTPEALADFKAHVVANQKGIANLEELDTTAQAENISQYSPVRPNESLESLQQSLGQMEEASRSLKEAADYISKSSNPSAKLPERVVNEALDALAERGQMVDLTRAAFTEDETKLGSVLDKMIVSLRSAVNAKQSGQPLTDQVYLQAIKTEIKRNNEQLRQMGSQGPNQTPPPQAPQGGPQTQPPTQPPTPPQQPPQSPQPPQGPAGGPQNANDL